VSVSYQHDYADREASLTLQRGAEDPKTLATGATYRPTGPLETVTLGNGLVEQRPYTNRYFPGSIVGGEAIHWQYTTDAVGNVLAITDPENPAESRSYGYQDVQYYLTEGNGPWGEQAWTYDRIGNRLTETADGELTAYTYTPNAAGQNSPQLHSTTENPPDGPVTRYFFDPAGNLTHENADRHRIRYKYSNQGRLSEIRTDEANRPPTLTTVLYDGRSFLDTSVLTPFLGITPTTWTTTATYSSEGTLHHRHIDRPKRADQLRTDPAVVGDDYVVYFAGRPLAQFSVRTWTLPGEEPQESSRVLYLTADHLGTPVLATDESGGVVWRGGFEPFGADYSGAWEAGVFLRFPGQWVDATWKTKPSPRTALLYNVYRWYAPDGGFYLKIDPVLGEPEYLFAHGNPIVNTDPLGLYVASGSKKFREFLDNAFQSISEHLKNDESRCCQEYFESFDVDIEEWARPGGLPYVVEAPKSAFAGSKTICGKPHTKPPYTHIFLNETCTELPDTCKIASALMHEIGHLARRDTHDNEPPEFFKKCNLGGCVRPGRFR